MKKRFAQMINLKKNFLLFCVVLFWGNLSFADTVTLQWNANTESDLAGYRLYYKTGTTSGAPYNGTGVSMAGQTYSSPIDVGNVTQVTVDVPEGQDYIFALTAYDNETPSLESTYSSEVGYTAIVTAPESQTYTVTFLAGNGGTVSGTTQQAITDGGSGASVTAVPDNGYQFVNWTGSGYNLSVNPLTVTNVTGDLTITANFELTESVSDSGDSDEDGVASEEEMGPDGNDVSYDGNHDGIPDSQQNDVVSLHMNSMEYRTFEIVFINRDNAIGAARLEMIMNPDTTDIESYSPETYSGETPSYSGGIYSFVAACEDTYTNCAHGRFTPEVRIYYHEALPALVSGQVDVSVWCDGSGNCYDFQYSEETGVGMIFPNRDGEESIATIKLQDGALGDSDETINGKIVY